VVRRSLFGFVFVGVVMIFFWAVVAAGRSPELAVNRILVEGNQRLSDGEILELLEFSEGANILFLDLDEVRTKLLRSAWVREVEIERVLPATLTLRITERAPVAVAVVDELYLLAADGTVLDQLSPHYDIEGLVLVRGLRDDTGMVPEKSALAGRLAEALTSDPRLSLLVSEIDVGRGAASIALQLREPPITLLVESATMVERLEEMVPLLGGIRKHYASLDVVDLRFDGRVYLRLRESAGNIGLAGQRTSVASASDSFPLGGVTF